MTELRSPINRIVLVWVSIAMVLLIALTGVTLALVAESSATSAVHCVNNVLGTRAGPATKDNAAHIAFAEAIKALFPKPGATPTPAEQAAGIARFEGQVNDYVSQLLADQADRNAHPLGKC